MFFSDFLRFSLPKLLILNILMSKLAKYFLLIDFINFPAITFNYLCVIWQRL